MYVQWSSHHLAAVPSATVSLTPSAVCTPTRYGVMTGRYCWRGKLKRGVINGYGKPVIEEGRDTVATLLGSAGYHTNIVGKWHLGVQKQFHPTRYENWYPAPESECSP